MNVPLWGNFINKVNKIFSFWGSITPSLHCSRGCDLWTVLAWQSYPDCWSATFTHWKNKQILTSE